MLNHPQISQPLREMRLAQAHHRCEWIDIDGTRCQNTMSLKLHHRTYEHAGNELADDLSVFCPSHHMIADIVRKRAVRQRNDVIAEWFSKSLRDKTSRLDNPERAMRFLVRLQGEMERFWDCSTQASTSMHEISEIIENCVDGQSGAIRFSDEHISMLRKSIWKIYTMWRCVSHKKLDILRDYAGHIENAINAYDTNTDVAIVATRAKNMGVIFLTVNVNSDANA